MRQAFFRNLLFLVMINLLIKPLYIFGIDVAVQNRLGPAEYGLYFVLFNFTFLFQVINDFGIQQFNNTHIAQHPHLLRKYSSIILSLKWGLAAAYLVITILTAWLKGIGEGHLGLLVLLSVNQILVSLIGYLRSNISALGLFRLDSVASVMDRILLIGFCSILLWGMQDKSVFTVYSFAWAQTIAYVFTVLFTGAIVLKHIRRFRFSFNHRLILAIFRQSAPYGLMILLMAIYLKMDAVFLSELLPDGQIQAGYYAQGFRLFDAANMFAFLFSTLLLPMFSKLLTDRKQLQELAHFSFAWMWTGAVIVSILFITWRVQILEILYTDLSAKSGEIFAWQMAGFPALALTYIYGSMLLAGGHIWQLVKLYTLAAILYLISIFVIVPRYGAVGTAAISCFISWFVILYELQLVKHNFGIQIPRTDSIKALGVIMLGIITNYTVQSIQSPWLILLAIQAFVLLLFVLIVKFLSLREAMDLIRSQKINI